MNCSTNLTNYLTNQPTNRCPSCPSPTYPPGSPPICRPTNQNNQPNQPTQPTNNRCPTCSTPTRPPGRNPNLPRAPAPHAPTHPTTQPANQATNFIIHQQVSFMFITNLSPWVHPQSAERANRSKAAAFIQALSEARAYADSGALPPAFATPAAQLYGAAPLSAQQKKQQQQKGAGKKAKVSIGGGWVGAGRFGACGLYSWECGGRRDVGQCEQLQTACLVPRVALMLGDVFHDPGLRCMVGQMHRCLVHILQRELMHPNCLLSLNISTKAPSLNISTAGFVNPSTVMLSLRVTRSMITFQPLQISRSPLLSNSPAPRSSSPRVQARQQQQRRQQPAAATAAAAAAP